ncbi:uncharacterized protein LOC127848086 isoform X1 [Dreissena polymorpha]|uniref:uncharacterized protein LOC127848086 isoform X1 n=1 Tax=Dreissena polymorpha TaxID=45954 RepID=UPI002264805A|nr:uncharacterized protein LOC127848086 isoform X1 [Dreissena polymorpha]
MAESSNTSTGVGKLAALAALASFVLHVVGFSTTHWYDNDFTHTGLWQTCRRLLGTTVCSEVDLSDIIKEFLEDDMSWLKATQAFEVLGFIAAVVALILIILYIFVPATSGKRIVFILSILACFAAAGCILLGIIIYGSEVKHNLSWSFALCCIAGIIFAISGLLLVVDMCKR